MDWTPDETTAELLRHYAIQNAIEYDGEGQAGSVMGRIMGERADLRPHAAVVTPLISAEVAKANASAAENGIEYLRSILEREAPHLLQKRVKERRTGLPELPNAIDGEVVLRFAPNPNGPLSFGHGRGVVINSEYAKRHDGTLILRFDDTDTSVKPPLAEAYELIQKEFEWLAGFPAHKVIYASDRIEVYHKHAVNLLEQGGGYVCTCPAEGFREFRNSKDDCPCRNRENGDNLALWKEMKNGGFQPGEAVVRVKTDMTHKNPALRDWPALRIQDTVANPHPRKEIGSKYRVWPLLDFQSAVEDHLQGVTHIIRGKDLMDSTRKQVLLYEIFGWNYPETIYWGRVKVLEFGGFSTSGMRKDIEQGRWSGWNDPCLPTMATLQRRGIQAEALRSFWVELGLTQKDISAALSTLYAHNTNRIDASAPRLSFVRRPHRILQVKGEDANLKTDSLTLASHPTYELGEREVELKWVDDGVNVYVEEEDLIPGIAALRLKDWADIGSISEGGCEIQSLQPEGDYPIVHWVPESASSPALLLRPIGPELLRIEGMLENNSYQVGTIVQLERIGYARIEAADEQGRTVLMYVHD